MLISGRASLFDPRRRIVARHADAHGCLPAEDCAASAAMQCRGADCCPYHPSGNAEPSPSDFHLTKQLQAALALFDIRLLDHFVVSANSIMSFVEQKML